MNTILALVVLVGFGTGFYYLIYPLVEDFFNQKEKGK